MGKRLLCVLMMTFLLAGCGGREGNDAEELALRLRGNYLESAGCSGTVQLTADYGERIYRYEMEFTQGEDETVLTLVQPDTVAGLTARLSKTSGNVLEYDEVVLETGPLNEEGLTPVGAVPAILKALRDGYLDTCVLEEWETGPVLRILIRDPERQQGEGLELLVWMEESGSVLRAEFSQDGACVIQCEFSAWNMI